MAIQWGLASRNRLDSDRPDRDRTDLYKQAQTATHPRAPKPGWGAGAKRRSASVVAVRVRRKARAPLAVRTRPVPALRVIQVIWVMQAIRAGQTVTRMIRHRFNRHRHAHHPLWERPRRHANAVVGAASAARGPARAARPRAMPGGTTQAVTTPVVAQEMVVMAAGGTTESVRSDHREGQSCLVSTRTAGGVASAPWLKRPSPIHPAKPM
jgi:hypothetical protein